MKLGVYHPGYLDDFYGERPGLGDRPYDVQLAALLGDFFGSSNFWTTALSRLGYETCDTVANADLLQRQWAVENEKVSSKNRSLFEVTLAQIAAFKPDILLIADYSTFTADFLRRVRADIPSIRLLVGWAGAPPEQTSGIREWDIALSCVPELVSEFCSNGLTSFHVNHAFEPRILDTVNDESSAITDFSFLGSLVPRNGFHIERERILVHLVAHTDLAIWSDLDGRYRNPLRRLTSGVDRRVRRRANPAFFGRRMFQQLRNSRVTLNTHIDASAKSASNMRLFEGTGMGACLLTDDKANLTTLFQPDVEVVTYSSPEECAEKALWLLANETERRDIAAAGQRRTLRDHNFASRAELIDEILRDAMARA